MKLEKYFLLLALGVFAFALQSCDDDDDDGISVPAELRMRWPRSIPMPSV